MLSGRFQLADPDRRLPSRTALVLAFGPRDRRPARTASWTRGADWMPDDSADVEVRYRDPTQMGKVYLLPAGARRDVPGYEAPDAPSDEQGPDADDPGADA